MNKKKPYNNIKLSNMFIIFGFLFFIAVMIRISYLSLSKEVDGINLQEFANSRTTKTDILYAKRGTIFDVNGDVLAQNVSSYTVIAYLDPSRTTDPSNPHHVVDKEYTAEKLSTILELTKDQILYYLNKDGLYQTEFGNKGRGITELTKDKIKEFNLPGIDFIETQKRNYPYGKFLSYTLGYAKVNTVEKDDGSSEEKIVGEMGIESQFNKELSGINGYNFYQKDRNGYKIAGTSEMTENATDGNDIYLTIDSNIQLFAEQALKKATENAKFDWMTLMVADAETGAILASATTPSFDPNLRNITSYLDYNISYAFEPGSTMKIYTYMSVLENGNYNGKEKYKSGVYTTKDGTQIGDWYRPGWGNISFDEGFLMSSNVGIINLIKRKIDGNILKKYFNKLGFGSKTNIELANESSGKVSFKYETEILNAGFGQGITTTPIQHIKALTAIANDGVLLQPYIINKIVNQDTGKVIYNGEKKELETVASIETVNKIKELMYGVVNTSPATGYYYRMNGYDLIGKTGTAQVPKESGKGYYANQTIASFAGMYPKKDPKIIIYATTKNINKVTALRDVVKEIVINSSKYLNIFNKSTSSNEKPLKTYSLKSYINKNTSNTIKELKDNSINIVLLGDGDKIIKQYPSSNTKITEIDKVFLVTNSDKITMPNIIGWSSSEVRILSNLLNLEVIYDGSGYVSEQSIKNGTLINNSSQLKVKLKQKK